MLSQYSNVLDKNHLESLLPDCKVTEDQLIRKYLFSPLDVAGIIVYQDAYKLTHAIFGLLPEHTKSYENEGNLTSAQAETIVSQRSFRMSIRNKRCLVPADSFYTINKMEAHRYFHTSQKALLFAGVYEEVVTPQGNFIRSFSIVTKSAQNKITQKEVRTPYCLTGSDLSTWMNPSTSLKKVITLLNTPIKFEASLRNHQVDLSLLQSETNDPSLHTPRVKEKTLFNL